MAPGNGSEAEQEIGGSCVMPEIVYESNKGIVFERAIYKNGNARLTVRNKANNATMATYRYKNAPGLQSPYLNWDNLNCVNGWVFDETYLYTAVQSGKKLYAGFTFHIAKDGAFPGQALPEGFYTEHEVIEKIEELRKGLPGDCVLGFEKPDSERHLSFLRHIYICKTGAISDYIDVDDVISVYVRFGIVLNDAHIKSIRELCAIPISNFASDEYMDYANPKTAAEWIVTGLLLGYPVETTASMFG